MSFCHYPVCSFMSSKTISHFFRFKAYLINVKSLVHSIVDMYSNLQVVLVFHRGLPLLAVTLKVSKNLVSYHYTDKLWSEHLSLNETDGKIVL